MISKILLDTALNPSRIVKAVESRAFTEILAPLCHKLGIGNFPGQVDSITY